MSAFVFLGPSLAIDAAREELDAAVYLPPVRRGDVYRLVNERDPTVIGIVDGLFDRVPAVVHKEILFALSKGVRVLGAASMGALRAAELWPFGMEGVGRIFEMYRRGEWDADDEVAVIHGPQESGFQAGSVALATIRLGLADAQARGVVSDGTARRLVRCAQQQFYADRSWQALYGLGARSGVPASELDALRSFVARQCPDAKRDDALALLRRVGALLESDEQTDTIAVDFDFEPTVYWDRLVTETHRVAAGGGDNGSDVSHGALERHLKLQPEGSEYFRSAALLHLLLVESQRRERLVTQAKAQAAADSFRRRRGLRSAELTRAWMDAQQLTPDEFTTLMSIEVTLETVLKESSASIRSLLPLELKRRGLFRGALEAIALKQRTLEELGVNGLTLDDVGTSFEALMDWYEHHYEPVEETLEVHATRRGFESVRDFLSELLLDYRIATEAGRARIPE